MKLAEEFTLAGVLIILTSLLCDTLQAETVDVKYRGPVNLAPFDCVDVSRTSFINRVCYDNREQYMVIYLNGTYYLL